MGRTRNIKPGFFKNEDLADLGFPSMLLFAGLWTLADRAGRLEDRPRRIKAEIFPYSPKQPVGKMLDELSQRKFILRYVCADERYIQVVAWERHQNPHHREAPSTIPPAPTKQRGPDGVDESSIKHTQAMDEPCTDQAQVKENASCPTSSLLSLSPLTLNTDPLPPDPLPPTPGNDSKFQAFWRIYPNKVGQHMASQMWISVDGDEHADEIMAGLNRWLQSHQWAVKKMIEKPENWLSRRLWQDNPPNVKDMQPMSDIDRTLRGLKDAN